MKVEKWAKNGKMVQNSQPLSPGDAATPKPIATAKPSLHPRGTWPTAAPCMQKTLSKVAHTRIFNTLHKQHLDDKIHA